MNALHTAKCLLGLERAGALTDLLIAHTDQRDRVAAVALDMLAAEVSDAVEALRLLVEEAKEVRHA